MAWRPGVPRSSWETRRYAEDLGRVIRAGTIAWLDEVKRPWSEATAEAPRESGDEGHEEIALPAYVGAGDLDAASLMAEWNSVGVYMRDARPLHARLDLARPETVTRFASFAAELC